MILTGPEIVKRIQQKDIAIEPFNQKDVNPNSYNLHLHHELLVYNQLPLDMRKDNPTEGITIGSQGLLLKPGTLYLGRTIERTYTRNLVPMLEGRSSIGRLGLFVHVTAGFGDTGFYGFWTLEIQCIHPIRIYAGVPICQIFYHEVAGEVVAYESGKYQKNKGVQSSRLWMDFQNQ
jgi:dCTP deaminase